MKTTFSKSLRVLFALGAALWLVIPPLSAQSPPGLSVQVSNGSAWLSITGAVGTVCEVQYVTNLAQTNAWLSLTNLTLASNPQLWVDTSCPATGRRFYRALTVITNPPIAGGVLVPAGSYTMGDCTGDGWSGELPLHTVYVSAFYMDTNLVSYARWQEVYQWATTNGYSFDHAGLGKAANHPVQTVNWYDVVKWCNARSEMGGLPPCYYTDASLTTVYRSSDLDLGTDSVNWGASGYRLPTEAEWEKAARGGLSGHRFPWGDTISESQANYISCSGCYYYDLSSTGYNPTFNDGFPPYTSSVGYFAANGYGLYDMAGNLFEWCWDWLSDTYYGSSPGTDPRGAASSPSGYRVLRGGSWAHYAYTTRSSYRTGTYPTSGMNSYGFRCVRGL